MKSFKGWHSVADLLEERAAKAESLSDEAALLDAGQCASIRVIAERLRSGRRALLVADEVGMGKTRIAAALMDAVRRCDGRTAVVMPAGLGAQWQAEIRLFNPDDRTLLPIRSYESFIRGFSKEGDDNLASGWQKRRDARLRDRRQQRELPKCDWRNEEILMISHAFARMAFPLPGNTWRRELMPAIEALCNTGEDGRGECSPTHRAACAAYKTRDSQDFKIKWPCDWTQVSSDDYRRAALPMIGRALGRFDLVVIDEAHKARGEDSSLSRILGPLIWESEESFRLGMTATPVELDAQQWINTLKRLFTRKAVSTDENDSKEWDKLSSPISDYAKIAKRLRCEPIDESLVDEFEKIAKCFVDALAPYVIRRDKRSDKELKNFQENHKVDYRDVRTVEVDPAAMGREWLRVFCAAEALSLLPATDRAAKRQRLTLDKGHGLANLALKDKEEGSAVEKDFWFRNVLLSNEAAIFEHPAILAAVKTVEEATAEGRKVLVFGTFVTPLEALTRLLDARAMIRHLADGLHWPARQVHPNAELAVTAALRSLDYPEHIPADDLDGINRLLKKSYDATRGNRDAWLRKLHGEVILKADQDDETASLLLQIWPAGEASEEDSENKIGLLLQALESKVSRSPEGQNEIKPSDWSVDDFLESTRSLLSDIMADTDKDFTEDSMDKTCSTDPRLQPLLDHLSDYSGRQGSFARLLYGKTAPQTRRFLQAAFNRAESWPMVLVAQSAVGREGLNLHEECRTVVLLHAEWNPGVVEQQIGRVDRKNSRFLKDYRSGAWREERALPPRIEVHCIQIAGGYDSFHWSVLRERWATLRAQLHGDVVSASDRQSAQNDPALAALVQRLDLAAPNFHPRPQTLSIRLEKPLGFRKISRLNENLERH